MNTPELHTERLRLRRFRKHDASDMEAFFRIYSDVETNTFLPWFPVRNMDEARAMFQERYAAVYEKEQGYAYAICLKDDNVPVGYMHSSMEDNHDWLRAAQLLLEQGPCDRGGQGPSRGIRSGGNGVKPFFSP